VVLRGGEEVDELAHLGLERGLAINTRLSLDPSATHLEEELENVNVVRLLSEVLLEQVIDRCLEHERVVDGDVADVGLRVSTGQDCDGVTYDAVPARVASAGDARIHHIVRNEEVGLQLPSVRAESLGTVRVPARRPIRERRP